jgi:hypothetical protein
VGGRARHERLACAGGRRRKGWGAVHLGGGPLAGIEKQNNGECIPIQPPSSPVQPRPARVPPGKRRAFKGAAPSPSTQSIVSQSPRPGGPTARPGLNLTDSAALMFNIMSNITYEILSKKEGAPKTGPTARPGLNLTASAALMFNIMSNITYEILI